MSKQTWSTPVLKDYGLASKITQQNNINFNKQVGSGDSIVLIVNGVVSNVPIASGGSLINTTVN
jgi:hypothetical protein